MSKEYPATRVARDRTERAVKAMAGDAGEDVVVVGRKKFR